MRISGGSAKGRKVGTRKAFAPGCEGDELRPTSAKVRESVFNILGGRMADCRFLDLFAGTGAVGIEALSRGAAEAIFVENNARRCAIMKDVVGKFGLSERSVIIKTDAISFLEKASFQPFDIIFIDPPYASGELEEALQLIDENQCLTDGGLAVAEHSSKKIISLQFRNLRLKKNYRYGDTALTVYEFRQLSQVKVDGDNI
jgi:16S rRNA (guanine966-N2)-methyltransferase